MPQDPSRWIDDLHARGAHFVLCGPDKRPSYPWKNYHRPDPAAVRRHIANGGLAAVIPCSLGLWLADVDRGGPAAVTTVQREVHAAAAAVTPTRRPGGYHVWFRARPGAHVGNGAWGSTEAGGDIRGSTGYAILWKPDILCAALADPGLNRIPFAEPSKIAKVDKRQGNPVLDDLLAAPVPTERADAETILSALRFVNLPREPNAPTREKWLRVGMAIHSATDGEGFDLWHEWSANQPNYAGKGDCIDRWKSFKDRPDGIGFGTLRSLAAESGWNTIAADMFDDLSRVRTRREIAAEAIASGPESRPGRRVLSSSELLDLPPENVTWLVEGMLRRKGVAMLMAAPKAGKSTLARYLSMCVARGEPFLGRNTERSSVLFMALQDVEEELQRLFRSLKMERADPIHFIGTSGPSENPEAELRWLIATYAPSLVVIDLLVSWTGMEDMDSYGKVSRQIDPFLRVARDTGACILLVHHSRKAARGEGPEDPITASLGSQAIVGLVDTVMHLVRDSGNDNRHLATVQRYGRDMEPTKLDFVSETGEFSLAETVRSFDNRKTMEAIAAVLDANPDGMLKGRLSESVKVRWLDFDRALKQLVEEGKVLIRTPEKGTGKLCVLAPPLFGETKFSGLPPSEMATWIGKPF